MLHGAAVQMPLGVAPTHVIVPEEPSAHAQAKPFCMLLFSMVQTAGVHSPLGVVPDHEMEPEKPSSHAQADPACILLLAMLHATAVHVPFGVTPNQVIAPPEKPLAQAATGLPQATQIPLLPPVLFAGEYCK